MNVEVSDARLLARKLLRQRVRTRCEQVADQGYEEPESDEHDGEETKVHHGTPLEELTSSAAKEKVTRHLIGYYVLCLVVMLPIVYFFL